MQIFPFSTRGVLESMNRRKSVNGSRLPSVTLVSTLLRTDARRIVTWSYEQLANLISLEMRKITTDISFVCNMRRWGFKLSIRKIKSNSFYKQNHTRKYNNTYSNHTCACHPTWKMRGGKNFSNEHFHLRNPKRDPTSFSLCYSHVLVYCTRTHSQWITHLIGMNCAYFDSNQLGT